jgi:hypothetical protein
LIAIGWIRENKYAHIGLQKDDHGWYNGFEEGKLYCEWDVKDAESIRQVFAKAVPEFPLEGIYKIELMFHSEDFR